MRTFMITLSIWHWSCLFSRRAKSVKMWHQIPLAFCTRFSSFPVSIFLHHPLYSLSCCLTLFLLSSFSPPALFSSLYLFSCFSVSPLPHPFSFCLFNKEVSVEESASTPSSLHWATASLRQETRWHTHTLRRTITSYCGTSPVAFFSFLFTAVYIILTFFACILLLFLPLTFSFLCERVIGFVSWHFLALFVLTKPFRFYLLNSFPLLYWCILSFYIFIYFFCHTFSVSSLALPAVKLMRWHDNTGSREQREAL